jgi:hypothetical protein
VSARRLQRFAALVVWASFVGSLHAQSNSKLRFVVLGHLRGDTNGELLANLPEVVAAVRAGLSRRSTRASPNRRQHAGRPFRSSR